ncbi:RNA ligase family protein [Spirochaeta cellobiosiphila]|uniref:RNA ligase family protein n=1 Tax=Spirochaeta cellobiosiphila TaxID=504483 RepID=UPI00041E8789|nr:RNA ligase family protein [Spirochaeta cellobiosiphila]
MNELRKYCRSLHAPISLGSTSDDRFMPSGFLKSFAAMEKLILTEKLDGQNNCFSKLGVFARSHISPTLHPWDKPMRERWNLIKNDLQDIEIFGENMYGIHSIAYRKLESYFYVFAVREKDTWLSWDEVKFYAEMYDFPTVPELTISTALKDIYSESKNENEILEEWLTRNLGMNWTEYVETSGQLGGYSPETGNDSSEGFVIRNAKGFKTNEGSIPVAKNEFNNLFKLVRKSHVNTDEHWTKTWMPAQLIDYSKYNWFGYEYLEKR